MRNVFRLLFIGVLLFALSGVVSAAEDIPGFKGLAWGTDFETVNQAKELKWMGSQDELEKYMGMKDTEFDEKGNLQRAYLYNFYNNKLVMGIILFYDRPQYFQAVKLLEEKFGKPVVLQGTTRTVYSLSSTDIVCDSELLQMMFVSTQYAKGAVKRDEEAKKAKKDKEFDRLFN